MGVKDMRKIMLRNVLFACLVLLGLAFVACAKSKSSEEVSIDQKSELPQIVVYKSPTCGCCNHWEDHLKMNGFKVVSHKEENMQAVKNKYGVTRKIASCHTALVGGYVIEGHVPAKDIKRLLREKPRVVGLTAPGMPQKSPGMQEHGKEPKNYDVLSFTKKGQTKVYASY